MYEFFILCRRPPPAPPGGIKTLRGQPQVDELPSDNYWKTIGGRFLCGEPSSVFRVHRTEVEDISVLESLAKAIADAGHGVVLSRIPVTMPWQFDLEHEGREPPADWPTLLARAKHYHQEKEREHEEARKKLAEEKARWEATMTAEKLEEIDFTDAFKVDRAPDLTSPFTGSDGDEIVIG